MITSVGKFSNKPSCSRGRVRVFERVDGRVNSHTDEQIRTYIHIYIHIYSLVQLSGRSILVTQ